MKKPLIFLTLLLTSFFVYPQITFERTYGGSDQDFFCGGVIQTIDGGYITGGESSSFGSGGGWLFKTNEFGDTLWTKTFWNCGLHRINSMKKTLDNGFILTGITDQIGPGGYSTLLIKTNSIGDTLWRRAYGGSMEDDGYDVIQTNDGGYAILGYTMSFGQAVFTEYLVKIDSVGDTLWTKVYEKNSYNCGHSILQLDDNGFILLGVTGPVSGTNDDFYLIRTNAAGDTLWTKTYGGISNEYGLSIKKTSDGGFILFGSTKSYGNGSSDVYIVKTNSNGIAQWTKTYGGISDDWAYDGIITSDGGFAIVGSTESFGAGGSDAYLIKINSNGDSTWTRTFGGIGDEGIQSILETLDGGYILSGSSVIYNNCNAYLIKTDGNGHVAEIDDYSFSKNNGIAVYPIPTNGKVNIQIPQQFGQTNKLEVFDCVGQKQFEKTNDFTDIDISSLKSGLFFIVLTNKENERQTIKIIKE